MNSARRYRLAVLGIALLTLLFLLAAANDAAVMRDFPLN